jgi:hypothetical protein
MPANTPSMQEVIFQPTDMEANKDALDENGDISMAATNIENVTLDSELEDLQKIDFLKDIVRKSLISTEIKFFRYYGYGDHAKRFAGPPTQKAIDSHLIELEKREKEAETAVGKAKLYAGIASAWFNDQDFPLWRDKQPEQSVTLIDSLRKDHVKNQAILDILTNDPFPSLNIDAELRYIRTAYDMVANKKSIAALPGLSTWASKIVGKGPMQEAVAEVIDHKLDLARMNQTKRQGLIDEWLEKRGRSWIDSFQAATRLSKSELDDYLSDHALNEQRERYDAAMCDLRPDGNVPDSAEENERLPMLTSAPPEQVIKIRNFLEELRAGDKKFDDSLTKFEILSQEIRSVHQQKDRPDSDVFEDLNSDIANLLLTKQVYDADDSNRGDARDLVRRLVCDMDEKAVSNVSKRDKLIAEEIETCKKTLEKFFASPGFQDAPTEGTASPDGEFAPTERTAAPDIEDDLTDSAALHAAAEQSSANLARRGEIFVTDWRDCMEGWERVNAWINVAKDVLKDEAEPFTTKRVFIHAKSRIINGKLKSLKRADDFIIAYPRQTKEEFYLKTLEDTIASVNEALETLKRIDLESETNRENEPDDKVWRRLEEGQDTKRMNTKSGFPIFATDYDLLESMAVRWSSQFEERQAEDVEHGLGYLHENLFEPQSPISSPSNPDLHEEDWDGSGTGASPNSSPSNPGLHEEDWDGPGTGASPNSSPSNPGLHEEDWDGPGTGASPNSSPSNPGLGIEAWVKAVTLASLLEVPT